MLVTSSGVHRRDYLLTKRRWYMARANATCAARWRQTRRASKTRDTHPAVHPVQTKQSGTAQRLSALHTHKQPTEAQQHIAQVVHPTPWAAHTQVGQARRRHFLRGSPPLTPTESRRDGAQWAGRLKASRQSNTLTACPSASSRSSTLAPCTSATRASPGCSLSALGGPTH